MTSALEIWVFYRTTKTCTILFSIFRISLQSTHPNTCVPKFVLALMATGSHSGIKLAQCSNFTADNILKLPPTQWQTFKLLLLEVVTLLIISGNAISTWTICKAPMFKSVQTSRLLQDLLKMLSTAMVFAFQASSSTSRSSRMVPPCKTALTDWELSSRASQQVLVSFSWFHSSLPSLPTSLHTVFASSAAAVERRIDHLFKNDQDDSFLREWAFFSLKIQGEKVKENIKREKRQR